jgi:penicillin-binding protein 1B
VVALAAAILVAIAVIVLLVYSSVELGRFERAQTRRATLVFAAPLPLAPGVNVRLMELGATLARLNYAETRGTPAAPGQFRHAGNTWEIFLRGADGQGTAQRVRVELRDDRIARVMRDGQNIGAIALEPEILTSAGDRPGEAARPVRLADVPLRLLNAVLAAEDHRFFEHGGLDVRGLARAAWANFRSGRVTQGGSTITQQLVKNRLLSPKRTLWRKAREAWLATIVEWRYPKEQILEAYLNEAYLGQRGPLAVRGVGAAARAYFGKEIHQLSLGECALIAGMLRAPNTYSPAVSPERARERRDVVLARLRELGRISAADLEAARREPVRVQPVAASGQPAPYFGDYVRQELEERFGDDVALTRGVRVFTTVDLALQRMAEAAIVRGLDRLETGRPALRRSEDARRLQAALVVLDPETGHIRALVGGRTYQTSQYNRAVLARRQPGSAFKPFVFVTALRPHGGPPPFTAASIVDDSPLLIAVDGQPWTPRNYQDRYEGRVSVRIALEHSLNAATVRVAETVGLPAVIETAHALGLPGDLRPVPALALGAFEVTPLDLARAYLPFVNGGLRLPTASGVRAVLDPDGPIEPASDDEPERVLSPAEAYLMTSLLEGVIKEGTGSEARALGVPGAIAGKTGTTNEGRDAWFVGYTPGLLTVVWVGFDDNQPHGLSGAQAALPIWADFMRQAIDAYPQQGFTVPGGVEFADIDATNGRLATRFCPVVRRETFLTGTLPEPCQEHGGISDQVRDWWNRLRNWLGR